MTFDPKLYLPYRRRWYLSTTLMTANCKEIGAYKQRL